MPNYLFRLLLSALAAFLLAKPQNKKDNSSKRGQRNILDASQSLNPSLSDWDVHDADQLEPLSRETLSLIQQESAVFPTPNSPTCSQPSIMTDMLGLHHEHQANEFSSQASAGTRIADATLCTTDSPGAAAGIVAHTAAAMQQSSSNHIQSGSADQPGSLMKQGTGLMTRSNKQVLQCWGSGVSTPSTPVVASHSSHLCPHFGGHSNLLDDAWGSGAWTNANSSALPDHADGTAQQAGPHE